MSRTQSLNDQAARTVAAAESDLEQLLAIELPAAFAAKVRARIAADAPVHRWRWGRFVLTLATAGTVILALTLRGAVHMDTNAAPPTKSSHADIVLSRPLSPADAPGVSGIAIERPSRASRRTTVARGVEKPEIIIDPSFAAAIRRLAMSSAFTSLDSTVTDARPLAGEPAPLSVVTPLDVPELVLKPADETGRQ